MDRSTKCDILAETLVNGSHGQSNSLPGLTISCHAPVCIGVCCSPMPFMLLLKCWYFNLRQKSNTSSARLVVHTHMQHAMLYSPYTTCHAVKQQAFTHSGCNQLTHLHLTPNNWSIYSNYTLSSLSGEWSHPSNVGQPWRTHRYCHPTTVIPCWSQCPEYSKIHLQQKCCFPFVSGGSW